MRALINKAAAIAAFSHRTQERKQGGPYIAHPAAVGIILARHGFSDEVVAAGLTHDVLEDTDFPMDQFRAELGDQVFAIVQAVTYDPLLSREEKRTKYVQTVRTANEEVKAVSIADKIANATDLLLTAEKEGRKVWGYFNHGRDKKLEQEEVLLAMFKETWQHPLVMEYENLVIRIRALD